MQEIGTWLRRRRQEKGLSIQDFSPLCGITGAQISRIETLVSKVTLNAMVRIAHGLGIDLAGVFTELDIYPALPHFDEPHEQADNPFQHTKNAIEHKYISREVITFNDLFTYIAVCRQLSGLSLRKLEKHVGITYNSIARLERGEITRSQFAELVALDKAMNLNGKLIVIAWVAACFDQGFR